MSFNDKTLKKWPKTMEKKFQLAQCSTDFKIVKVDENLLDKYYILLQPTGGHYKGHKYILEMITKYENTILYPFTQPLLKFKNTIWHPNISVTGDICVDIIKGGVAWSPANGIDAVISSIILLMDIPENSDPFNNEAAILFRACEKKYNMLSKKPNIDTKKIYDICYEEFDSKTKSFAGTDIDQYLNYFNDLDDQKN